VERIAVVSAYPVSKDFRGRLETGLRSIPRYYTLVELRQIPWYQMIKTLRGIRCEKIIIALDSDIVHMVLPILKILSILTRCKVIETVNENIVRHAVNRMEIFPSIIRIINESILGYVSLMVINRRCKRLASIDPGEFKANGNKILYLKTNLMIGAKAGGSIGHIAGVANAFCKSGYKVTIASAENPIGLVPEIKWLKMKLMKSFGFPFENNYYRFSLLSMRNIINGIIGIKPNIIYQRMSVGNILGVELSRKLGVPLILEYNGSEVWIARNWGNPLRSERLGSLCEEVSLRHAHLVVTISDVLKRELIDRGVNENKIVMYPNCIDPCMFDPDKFSIQEKQNLLRELSLGNNNFIITFLGTFGQWHGTDILAKAIRELIDEDRLWLDEKRIKFMLIGDGMRMSAVKEILGRNSEKYVILTGLIAQHLAPIYLSISDILLSPHAGNNDGSRFFGSPTKLFEYMAMGKAIIASNLDQIGEILQPSLHLSDIPIGDPSHTDRRLSFLVRPGEHIDIVMAIKFLVESKRWRAELGKNARVEALLKYTWEKHVHKILEKMKDNDKV